MLRDGTNREGKAHECSLRGYDQKARVENRELRPFKVRAGYGRTPMQDRPNTAQGGSNLTNATATQTGSVPSASSESRAKGKCTNNQALHACTMEAG